MQGTYALRQEGALDNDASEIRAQLIQWTVEACVCRCKQSAKVIEWTPREDHCTSRSDLGRVTMIVLGAYWAVDPPIVLFWGLKPEF